LLKKNNEKRKWYFLIAVALIVGAMIGYFATERLSLTGNAKNILNNTNPELNFEKKESISISDLSKGIYIVKVNQDDFEISKLNPNVVCYSK